jgi:hypothetical protein
MRFLVAGNWARLLYVTKAAGGKASSIALSGVIAGTKPRPPGRAT